MASLEGDNCIFLEDILAMMMSGDSDCYLWLICFRGLSFLISLYGLWVSCYLLESSILVLHSPLLCSYCVLPLHILSLPEPLSWAHPFVNSREAGTPWQARSSCHGHTARATCHDLLGRFLQKVALCHIHVSNVTYMFFSDSCIICTC